MPENIYIVIFHNITVSAIQKNGLKEQIILMLSYQNVDPKGSERFHLKLLLNRIKEATSFEDLKTFAKCKEVAIEICLIETHEKIYKIFDEAITIMMPKQLRQFFAFFIMSENTPLDYQIWEKYKKYFIKGFKNNNIENAHREINNILKSENF